MDAIVAPSVAIAAAGPMRVTLDGAEAPVSSRKALALLVYLALQPSRSESRERVAALLWSDSGGDHARAALRQTLRRLKADLGPAEALVDADRSMLRLNAPVRVDIVEACEAAERGETPALLAREDGGLARLFADLEDLDPDFNLWIAVQRERLTAQLIGRLEAALAASEDPRRTLALAEALCRADPTHEGAARAAMQAHLAMGDTIQAMRVYERLWRVLDEDLEVEPSEKTQALYVAIKQGQAQPAAPAPAELEMLAPIAIVVEPTPTSDFPAPLRYIAQSFRHEMVGALTRFRDWMVIDGPRNGSSPPAYRAYDLRITMHDQQGGLVVAMSLTDRASGRLIWSERQAAALDDLARLQRSALRNLALALNVHLSAPRLQTAREITGPTGQKYERWLCAQALMGDWRPAARIKAEEILRDLVATTPDFAPALIALAQNINVRAVIFPGLRKTPEQAAESLALTTRAVGIDPLDGRAHLCSYWACAYVGQHAAATSHLSLALDLNENDPWTIISSAVGFAYAGDIERSAALVEQSRTFGMRHSRVAQGYVATALHMCGDHAASVAIAELAGDAITNLPAWAAASHICLGDGAAAAAAIGDFLRIAREGWMGRPNPSDLDVLDWFMHLFPIRSEAVRADLRAQLIEALAERKKRQP